MTGGKAETMMKMMKKLLKAMSLCLAMMMLALPVMPGALADSYTLLKRGDSGEQVLRLQQRLLALGYETTETNGVYGEGTERAVSDFQRQNSLLVTGIADQTTQRILFSDRAARAVTAMTDELALSDGMVCETEEAAEVYYTFPMTTSMPAAVNASARSAVPDLNRDSYAYIRENGFQSTASAPLSTFAADVDTSSYAQVRSRILRGTAVPADSVRTEEMLNYFRYAPAAPQGGDPFGVTMELTDCPWNDQTKLLRILLTARESRPEERTPRHLIFLIDTSGSMEGKDRLDLVKRAFLMLLDSMDGKDYVSIVTYASREETLLEHVPASEKTRIMEAITDLKAGGWTNGSAGLLRAYDIADRFMAEGQNTRILLATDGDLNVGVTSEGDLARLVMEKKQTGTALTVLGFGYGNYQDDRLQALANYGDGNCFYIDTIYEARKALVTEAGGTFDLVASDVKIQLDFNPAQVRGYRLIGYENKLLAAEDFANGQKDGGDSGAGQQMTALYEIVPVDSAFEFGAVESRYSTPAARDENAEWLTLSLRAKVPGEAESQLYTYPLTGEAAAQLSADSLFAAAVAETCMCLRDSAFKGTATYAHALEMLRQSQPSGDPYREEFVYLVTLLERAE